MKGVAGNIVEHSGHLDFLILHRFVVLAVQFFPQRLNASGKNDFRGARLYSRKSQEKAAKSKKQHLEKL